MRAWPIAALTVLVIIAGCGSAQGGLLLSDETGSLDRGQLEAAAAPLIARGARVALFMAASGDETGADLTRRLDGAGLLEAGEVTPDVIVIYVSNAPRYSELRAGARWSGRLPDAFLREARAAALNPALRGGQPLAGMAATLGAIEARLANPPLAERVWRWLGAAAAAGVALALLALSPAGPRLGRWWRASPPGRLARWLADQTPWGRRRLERVARMTRLRMEDRAAYARSWCKAASGPRGAEGAALMARLKSLDQQRAALGRGGAQGRALAEAMDGLAWAYERLGHEAARLVPARPPSKPGRKRRAASSSLTAGTAAGSSSAADTSSSDTPSSWDLGGGDSGPSSDGGPW